MLAAVALAFGLLVLLFALPIDLAVRLERVEAFTGQLRIRWLFGAVRLCIDLPSPGRPRKAEPNHEARPAKAKAKRGTRGRRVLAALRQAAFRRRVYRLLGDLAHAAHPRRLRLKMRLGLGDPADTGMLWALLGPLNAAARALRHAEVSVEPEFIDPKFEFELDGRFHLVPLQILAVVARFALSPPAVRAWRALRSGHA